MSDQSDLERSLQIASKELAGAHGRTAQGTENKYGQAYQALVRAGFRQQLRKKYRTAKG